MRTIRVERTMNVPPLAAFEVLTDHARYARFPGVRSAAVVRPGKTELNGLGAVREIDLGLSWFEEEITVFERPTRFEYQIIRSRPPIEHQLGRVDFEAVPEGVRVTWTSTFQIKLPVFGNLATSIAVRQMTRGFEDVLRAAEECAK